MLNHHAQAHMATGGAGFYPWQGETNALTDIIAGISQNTIVPGAEVNAWASRFGPCDWSNPAPGTAPIFDSGGVPTAGVDGLPSNNFDGVDNYLGMAVERADDVIGAMPGPFAVVVTCRVMSAPTVAGPSFAVPAICAANTYRTALKVYRKTADSNYYAFAQSYNGSFSYVEQLIGAALPNRLVLCMGWLSGDLYISVNGAAPTTLTVAAPQADTDGQEWLLGLDFYAAPVYGHFRLARQMTKSSGAFPSAAIAAELTRQP